MQRRHGICCGAQLRKYRKDERYVDLDLSEYNVRFRGDVKLVFFDHDNIGSPDKVGFPASLPPSDFDIMTFAAIVASALDVPFLD